MISCYFRWPKSTRIYRAFIICLFLLLLAPTILLTGGEGINQVHEYQKNSDLQWQWAMEGLASFPFSENEKVLDLGCGNGKVTAYIAEKAPLGIVVGLDISEPMLAFARKITVLIIFYMFMEMLVRFHLWTSLIK